MLFSNRRVEEELERIRLANLPPAKPEEEVADVAEADDDDGSETAESDTAESETGQTVETVELGISAKDILAMILAAFSIILPYAAIFIGLAILFVYIFLW